MRTDLGDHLHEIGLSDGDEGERHPERITHFDYDSVSRALGEDDKPEDIVDFADAASAIKSILLWICSPPDLVLSGARAASLLAWLDPIEAKTHGRATLSAIARQSGYTKQALSKALVELRDDLGLTVGIGKSMTARAKYRNAAATSLKRGTHVSQVRTKRSAKATATDALDVVSSAQ